MHSRFVVYGGERLARQWQEFLLDQDALTGWRSQRLGPFGDVDVIVFYKVGDSLAGKVRDPGE